MILVAKKTIPISTGLVARASSLTLGSTLRDSPTPTEQYLHTLQDSPPSAQDARLTLAHSRRQINQRCEGGITKLFVSRAGGEKGTGDKRSHFARRKRTMRAATRQYCGPNLTLDANYNLTAPPCISALLLRLTSTPSEVKA